MQSKKILFAADLHCGSRVGLRPPEYRIDDKYNEYQKEMYDRYREFVSGEWDAAVWVGDLIDGKGERSGGTEEITTDRKKQCAMAIQCISEVKAKAHVFIYGTAYHTGQEEDFEEIIAEHFESKIKAQAFIGMYGNVFDVRHHNSSTSVPHGVPVKLKREHIWNILWAEYGIQPKANITIRAHTHRYAFNGDANWLGINLPALQGLGTKYGGRRCEGTVDFGVVCFEVYPDGSYQWQKRLAVIRSQKEVVVEL